MLFNAEIDATGYGLRLKLGAGINACFFFQNLQHANRSMLLVSAVVHPLFAQAPAAPGGNALMQFLPIIFIFAAMYFFMIAPQRKKQKEHQKMLQSLSPGDEIVTTGGVYGTVTGVKDDRFIVRVADATKIELGKSFVHAVVKKADNTSAAK